MISSNRIPHSMRIILTRRCNLECDFCLINASQNPDEGELNTTNWLNFFQRLKELKVFNISISGGEIFLRKDLFTLLKRLRENRMHRITLLTNGTLITEKTAMELKKLKIKHISISIDGLKETHNRIRGKGSFEKTLIGITRLLSSGITPCISFTPIKSNYLDLGPVIDLVSSLKLPILTINSLSPEGRCGSIYEDIALKYPDQISQVLDVINEKKKMYPNLKIKNSLGFYFNLPQSYLDTIANSPVQYEVKKLKSGCGAASTSCAITPVGDIIPCEGFSMFAGGNILRNDIMDVWNNSENFKLIRDLATISLDKVPYCKDCKYNILCSGGCRASAYITNHDLRAPGMLCPYWKQSKAKQVQYQTQYN